MCAAWQRSSASAQAHPSIYGDGGVPIQKVHKVHIGHGAQLGLFSSLLLAVGLLPPPHGLAWSRFEPCRTRNGRVSTHPQCTRGLLLLSGPCMHA